MQCFVTCTTGICS